MHTMYTIKQHIVLKTLYSCPFRLLCAEAHSCPCKQSVALPLIFQLRLFYRKRLKKKP